MSGGPIEQWRDAWKPAQVTTAPATSLHAYGGPGRSYCGRKRVAVGAPDQVNCSDCLAALEADRGAEPC